MDEINSSDGPQDDSMEVDIVKILLQREELKGNMELILNELILIFMAGVGTSAATLSNLFMNLIKKEECKRKCLEEIRQFKIKHKVTSRDDFYQKLVP